MMVLIDEPESQIVLRLRSHGTTVILLAHTAGSDDEQEIMRFDARGTPTSGDPLGQRNEQLRAYTRKVRDGFPIEQTVFGEIIEAAIGHSVAADDRDHDNLLLRATAAEEVSWAMDAYVKGNHRVDVPSEAEDTHLTELQRIDLHDLKVRIAGRLSNFASELNEMREALVARGYENAEALSDLKTGTYNMQLLNKMIEPRRLFKKD